MTGDLKVDRDGNACRVLPDGRCLRILEMTYNKFRLTLSKSERAMVYEDGW